MKRAILILMGFSPILIGLFINHQIAGWRAAQQIPTGMLTRVGIAMLVMWGCMAWLSDKLVESRHESLLFLNAGATVALASYMVHELLLDSFFTGIFGLLTQWFYLPMFFLSAHTLSTLSIDNRLVVTTASYCLLVMMAILGTKLSPKFRGTSLLSR